MARQAWLGTVKEDNMIYQWSGNGFGDTSLHNADPQAVGERLEKLRAKRGVGVTTQEVVDDARPKSAATHALFEWDDSIAAGQWRNNQAGMVLRSIRIVFNEDEAEEPRQIIANVSIVEPGGRRVYMPAIVALSDSDLRAQILAEAFRSLEQMRTRFHHLEELNDVMNAIGQVLNKHRLGPPERGDKQPVGRK
jgi:hypothetical protein